MASPFPGMDPYLEHPEVWPGVHLLLIAALAETLSPLLRPKYSVSVEVRMYESNGEQSLMVGIPDVSVQKAQPQSKQSQLGIAVAEKPSQPIPVRVPTSVTIRQGFLEIREVATKEVVVAIELLSPINKRPGRGRQTYENKRQRVLSSSTHLVEVDLLRAYEPMPVYGESLKSDYRVLVSQSDRRPEADLYTFNLRDRAIAFQLPLLESDQPPTIDLQNLLDNVYERSGYDLKLDYRENPLSPVAPDDLAWLERMLKEKSFR